MNLKWIMLSERKQIQKATFWMPSIWHSCNGKTIGTENRCGCRELGVGREVAYQGAWKSFGDDGTFQYLHCAGGYTTVSVC